MDKIILFVLIFFSNVVFGISNAEILRKQIPSGRVVTELREDVPYLQQEFLYSDAEPRPSRNSYVLKFDPSYKVFDYFAKVTGRSIFKTKFTVSWYVFTNINHIPKSVDDIMGLVNRHKPVVFDSLSSVNGGWRHSVELPYKSLQEDAYVFAYLSFPNTDGVLVPLGGESFYLSHVVDHHARERTFDLNQGMLTYWEEKGYL